MMNPVNDPLLLPIKEAARLTGLSQSTLVRLIERGEIPCVHVGRRRLVKYDHLREWVDGLRG